MPANLARILYCFAFSAVTFDTLAVVEYAGFHLKAAYGFLLGSMICVLIHWAAHGTPLREFRSFLEPLRRPPFLFAALLVVLCFALTARSPSGWKSLGYSCWGLFDLLAFCLLGIHLFQDDAQWRNRLIGAWFAGIVFQAAVALLDFTGFFFGHSAGLVGRFQASVLHTTGGSLPRPQAFSYEPSFLALAIGFLVPLALLRGFTRQTHRRVWLGLYLFLTAVLVVVYSRGGWLLWAAETLLVMICVMRRGGGRLVGIVAVAVALLLVVVVLVIPSPQRRQIHERFILSLADRSDPSMRGRLQSISDGFRLGFENPLGAGPGSAMHVWLGHYAPGRSVGEFEQQATPIMSLWPEIFLEQGAVGLFLALAFFLSLGRLLWMNPSTDARGIFFAYAPVVLLSLWLMPTLWRADLWSLTAMAAIHLPKAEKATTPH